jgi:hypothetical protein
VVGGLLFVPLTRDYLKTWGDNWWQTAPRDLVVLYEGGIRSAEREEPVVLQKVLADRVNQGFHEVESLLIDTVCGTLVRSLSHLVELVEASHEPFLRFVGTDGTQVVVDRKKADKRGSQILRKFSVPHDRSPDLRQGA